MSSRDSDGQAKSPANRWCNGNVRRATIDIYGHRSRKRRSKPSTSTFPRVEEAVHVTSPSIKALQIARRVFWSNEKCSYAPTFVLQKQAPLRECGRTPFACMWRSLVDFKPCSHGAVPEKPTPARPSSIIVHDMTTWAPKIRCSWVNQGTVCPYSLISNGKSSASLVFQMYAGGLEPCLRHQHMLLPLYQSTHRELSFP